MFCLLILTLLSGINTATHTDLSADVKWTLSAKEHAIIVPGTVPGNVYLDLWTSGLISNPYYRNNDINYRWVSYETWTYSTNFTVHEQFLHKHLAMLVCKGIDTVSDVTLNGKLVGTTDNMFVAYRFDVSNILKENNNTLSITIHPATVYARQQATSYPYYVPPDCPPDVQNGECYYNFIRKEASSFSWDWGPAFPSAAIWKDVYIEHSDSFTITEVSIQSKKVVDETWDIAVSIYIDNSGDVVCSTQHFTVTFILEGLLNVTRIIPFRPGTVAYTEYYTAKNVELWWPNGHGAQRLYTSHIHVQSSGYDYNTTKLVGFRTVELIQEPVKDSPGLSFYFKINDKPIYMKGSNWIPADSFQTRVDVDNILRSAAEANMNMIRVWGGGIYESETLYNVAAQLGIMIWQDMMFACAYYPTNDRFLLSVEIEIAQQIRRLVSHVAIVIWAGNNENEAALVGDWFNVKIYFPRYYVDYMILYNETIRNTIRSYDQTRPFLLSSPTNGKLSDEQGGVAINPYDDHYGDVHYYNYTCDSWKWQCYPTPRFTSEYGLQSWCSTETLRNVSIPEKDWIVLGNFSHHREHRTQALENMRDNIALHFIIPTNGSTTENFENFVYLSQINQAVAIKTETEHYRRYHRRTENGKGMNMGALYWQLNDIWQAPTWSSLEYGGKWKMLHYYAAHFFSPSIISPMLDNDRLHVYYINDGSTSSNQHYEYKMFNGVHNMKRSSDSVLLITCFSFDSFQPLKNWTALLNNSHIGSVSVYNSSVSRLLQEAGCDSSHCFLYFSVSGHSAVPDNWITLKHPRYLVGLQKTNIKLTSATQLDNSTISLTITTQNVAFYVWLEVPGVVGHFSDNGFLMVTVNKQILYHSENIRSSQFTQLLTIKSLIDIY